MSAGRAVDFRAWGGDHARMQARAFWRAVTVDRTDVLDRVLAAMGRLGTRFCVIGGVAPSSRSISTS